MLQSNKGLKMFTKTKKLSELTLRELVDGIGKQIITQDTEGMIHIGTLKTVNCQSNGYSINSITVEQNGVENTWQNQWMNSVFV